MPSSRTLKYTAIVVAVVVTVLLLPVLADAQCSMCRAVLSNSNAKFIRNLNIGVLVLLVPPVSMFCTIFIVLRRHNRDETGHDSTSPEHNRDAHS